MNNAKTFKENRLIWLAGPEAPEPQEAPKEKVDTGNETNDNADQTLQRSLEEGQVALDAGKEAEKQAATEVMKSSPSWKGLNAEIKKQIEDSGFIFKPVEDNLLLGEKDLSKVLNDFSKQPKGEEFFVRQNDYESRGVKYTFKEGMRMQKEKGGTEEVLTGDTGTYLIMIRGNEISMTKEN
jgi:hypothetical protein